MAIEIFPIPCLEDNYAYLLHEARTRLTVVVDPSEPEPIRRALKRRGWGLDYIWNTHHHWDHVGGNLVLKEEFHSAVVGFCGEQRIPGKDIGVREGEPFSLGSCRVQILEVPGHTLGAIAFWLPEEEAVFTGDTLFLMGCGRLFEGTPQMMWESLTKLSRLPVSTRVYCGHEYSVKNAQFALTVEPKNQALQQRLNRLVRLRAQDQFSVPGLMGEELTTNPFLLAANAEVFAEIRRRKDTF